MITAAIVLLLQTADIDAAVVKGLKIDAEGRAKVEARGKDRKEVLATLLDPKVFADGVRRIDSKLGLWTGTFDVTITFDSGGLSMPAWSDGRGGITIDADILADYAKKAKAFQKQVKAGATFIVPPARMEAIIWHELTHGFTPAKLPDWLNEGAGTYVAGDPHFVAYFRNDKQAVRDIDAEIGHKYAYARGWAFLEWLEAKKGSLGVKKFFALLGAGQRTPSEAAADVTGLAWDKLKVEERDWSAKWIANLPVN